MAPSNIQDYTNIICLATVSDVRKYVSMSVCTSEELRMVTKILVGPSYVICLSPGFSLVAHLRVFAQACIYHYWTQCTPSVKYRPIPC